MIREQLIEILHQMEEVTKLFKLEKFDIYLIGGSACILGEYTTRATLDIDFVDLGYPSAYGKVFALLRDYDMLEYQSTILSPNYKDRAIKLDEFNYINVYVLAKEKLNQIIDEILKRTDLFDSKREEFIKKLKIFKEKYDV